MLRIENTEDELHVYVSDIMTDDTCKEITDAIKLAVKAGVKKINSHINTYGGSVRGAYDIISTIKSNNLFHKAINEGYCISAGSILLASADYAIAYDYSSSMIHDPSMNGCTLEETEGSMRELLQTTKDGIMTILKNRIKVSDEVLSKMLQRETSWNSYDQLKYGLVDEIIYTSKKPFIEKELKDIKLIYNIIEQFNTENVLKEITINSMTKGEIDALISENETLKAKIIEIENKIKGDEPTNVEQPVVENVVVEEPVIENVIVENVITDIKIDDKLEIINLKTENFILKNKLEDKSTIIENAVKLHGVEVLNTLISFINNDSKKLADTLQNTVNQMVNDTNNALDGIINNTGVIDYEEMAENIFGMKSDGTERIKLKQDNPELHDKLFNVYYGITE